MQVQIDYKKKQAVITVELLDTPVVSSTGSTESIATVRNQAIGQNYTDGRPLKLSLQLYVKPPKA